MNKNRQSVLIFTHAVMYGQSSIHGPAHAVSQVLQKTADVVLLEHPLTGVFPSQMSQKKRRKAVLYTSFSGPIRWLLECVYNIYTIVQLRPDVVIAIDPINALSVIFLQAIGLVPKFVYYTVDFADVRSSNPLMDWLYHQFDQLASESADQCWAVSERILSYRKNVQRIPSSRLFFIPNSPPEVQKKSIQRKHDKDALIIVSNIHKGVGFEEIFSAFFRLTKEKPTLTLTIIGDGEERSHYESLVEKKNVRSRVKFLGRLSHAQVHDELARAGVGLALYTGSDPHRYYSDSMKARDYLALGLPVIISGDLGTAEDIMKAKAGLWVKLSVAEIISAIRTVLVSNESYMEFSANALQLARDRSFPLLVHKAWSQL